MGRASVIVDILVNSRDSARDMAQAASGFDKFGGAMESLAVPAGIAAAAIGGTAVAAVRAASDLQQASGGVDAVFKTSADSVHAWATTAAQDVGLASSEYKTMAAQIGGALVGMGIPLDQAAQSTHDLMLRAADLASVYGGTTAQATEAVSSAFRGEYDALQRLIPSVSAKAVADQMAAESAAGMTYASEEQAKAAAITNLIMEKSAGVTGNFAKEADTAAGSQAIASASFRDTAAALGEQLIPYMVTAMEWFTKIAKWVSENIPLVTALAVVIGTLAAAVLLVNAATAAYAAVQAIGTAATAAWAAISGVAAGATAAFGAAMAFLTSPIFLVVAAIAAVIAIVVLLVKNWDTVKSVALSAWNAILVPIKAVERAIQAVIAKVREAIQWFKNLASNIPVIGGIFKGAPSAASYSTAVMPSTRGLKSQTAAAPGGITVNFNGIVGDPAAVARQLRSLMLAQERRTGAVYVR